MTISSVISSSPRVLHIFFFPSHRRHMKQMTCITSRAHTGFLWAIQAEREIWPASPHLYRRPPGCCSPLEPQPTGKALQRLIELPPTSFPPPLFSFLFFFFFTDSFVVLIHHGKGRSRGMTVCKVACTVRVNGLEGMNSDHLWLLMKEKMPSFRDHTCPKPCCGSTFASIHYLLEKASLLKICIFYSSGQLIIVITHIKS